MGESLGRPGRLNGWKDEVGIVRIQTGNYLYKGLLVVHRRSYRRGPWATI